ncbi:MAG: O-antigen ligase family protein [Planctomycetes bacterium]|nr:O-antigen ligase family protein [Planctomycetota bacterium]
MSSLFTNVTSRKGDGNITVRPHWHLLQVLPVTLTIVLGPPIAVAYRLAQWADVAQGSLSVAQAARGLLCILMFFSMILPKELNLLKHRLVRPLLFLAAYAVLTSFASPYRYEHIVFAVKLAFIVLIFASTFRLAKESICTERWLTTCAWVIVLIMAVCIALGLATGSTVAVYKSRYATAGFTENASVASCLILSALPVFVRLISNSRSAIAAIVLLFTSLFFTMRRSSLIAGVAAMCISFLINLIYRGRRAIWRRTMVPICVLVLLAGIGLNTTAGTDLMRRFRDLNPYEGSGAGRYIFWKISLEHIVNRPVRAQLLGEGMGSIRGLLGQRFGHFIGAHNDWLDLVNAFGLFGLIGITWWYFELVRLAWCFHIQRKGLFQGMCASVIILGLMSIGTGGSFNPSWALSYAAMGFWAGHAEYTKQHCCTEVDCGPV